MTLFQAFAIAENVKKWYKQELLLGKMSKEEFNRRVDKIENWIDANVGSKRLITLGVYDNDSRG